MLLRPVLVLAFALLHLVYQVILLARQTKIAIQKTIQADAVGPPASFTCLEDLLAAYERSPDSIRVPNHLAVVLADTSPSSIRLYLSTVFQRIGRRETTARHDDIWYEFRAQYQAAVQEKRASDVAAIVHLARVSGVQQLSVYTSEPLSRSALQSMCRTLQSGYKTKVVLVQQQHQQQQSQSQSQQQEAGSEEGGRGIAGGDDAGSWTRYDRLRKRANRSAATKSSESSSTNSPESTASSDSEIGPCSLDETMASSYTADSEGQEVSAATVNVCIGIDASRRSDRTRLAPNACGSTPVLQVSLLSRQDGQKRFLDIVSSLIEQQATSYLYTVLMPDMKAHASSGKRFSSSSLRKSWMTKRDSLTVELSVAELDRSLLEAGYTDEPDLLVVFGERAGLRKLYGFPAWPLRVTDLFFDPDTNAKRAYGASDFVAALTKLGKMEQRYGR